MPLGVCPRHRTTGGDRLVVGMCVERDQGAHQLCFTAPEASSASMRVGVEAPIGEHLGGVLAVVGRRPIERRLGAAEARGGRRLGDPERLDERAALDVVRVPRRLVHAEHRGEADVGVLHDRAPLVAGAPAEQLGEPLLQLGPQGTVVLACELLVALEPGEPQELGVELRLDRADRHVLAVGALVDVVVVRARVEHVHAALGDVVDAHVVERPEERHQGRGAVDHRGVDHLTLAAAARLEQRAHHAERQEHAAAAEVADEVERRHRRLAGAPDVGQGPGERDVVDVVSGGMRVGAGLPPSGHASVHQLRVAAEAHVGAETQPLHHAGPEALDQRVGARHEVEQGGDAVGVLEVDRDVATAAPQHVAVGRVGRRTAHRAGPLDPDDVGAEIGQEHRRERPGPDARQLDHADAGEGPGHDATSMPLAVAAAACADDRTDDDRPERLGAVVAHVLDLDERGAGHELGGAAATARVDQRVVEAVDHQHRHPHLAERSGAVAARVDGGELARRPLRVERAVVVGGGPQACGVGVEVPLRRPHGVALGAGDVLVARRWRRREEHLDGLLGRGAVGEVADRRHDRGDAVQPVGELDRHVLHDHAAHRRTDRMGSAHAEVIEQADAVRGHLGQRVRHLGQRCARDDGRHRGHAVAAHAVELRRQAAVAVVEADDVVAVVGGEPAEPVLPAGHLRGEPRNQQQRGVGR